MKTVTLELEENPGCEIVVRISDVPVGVLYDVNEAAWPFPATREEFRALAAKFAPFLVSWALPGEATAEGLEGLDVNVALAIINGWVTEVAKAPLPLLRRSSAGDMSQPEDPR